MQTKQLNELFTDYPDGLYCLIRVTVKDYNGKAKLQFMHFESLGKGIPGFVVHFDKLPLTFYWVTLHPGHCSTRGSEPDHVRRYRVFEVISNLSTMVNILPQPK